MIEIGRVYTSVSLFLLTITLTCHFLAMEYPHWKIYEHRKKSYEETVSIGIFHRCDNLPIDLRINSSQTYPICFDNKYCYRNNPNCNNLTNNNTINKMQYYCNLHNNPYNCDYSSITKGLISCTIIAGCMLGISLFLIVSHILINQFKYKTHLYISAITIVLLFLGFLFMLITLILLGSTMSYDLHQYRYNLDYRVDLTENNLRDAVKHNITNEAAENYTIRLDWASGLEIAALILSSFILVIQIVHLFSTYRNRIG